MRSVAQQLERQQTAHRLVGGDHLGTRQTAGLDDPSEIDAFQQRHEQEQAGEGGAKRARRQIQAAHIGDLGDVGLEGGRAFLIAAARQSGEALLAQQHGQGVDADGVIAGGQFALDVVDREVAFAQADDQLADWVAGGRRVRAGERAEEGRAFCNGPQKLDTKTALS